jgi:hypothetical protein
MGISKEEIGKTAANGMSSDEYEEDEVEKPATAKKDSTTAPDGEEGLEVTEEQRESIERQFKMLYDQDEELRTALAKSDINAIGLEDKFQIIEAYMSEGGVKGLQFQVDEEEADDVEISRALDQMSVKEKQELNDQFQAIYEGDEELRKLVEDPESLSLL